MPASRKLKVFRTPIGFHDAYVAAPSQKAALEAWGSDANLFARGVAEQVTDSALTAEPLAHPGQVVRKLRGSAEEQLAALPPDEPSSEPPAKAAKPKPRPSREALESAEQALAETEERHRSEQERLAEREQELARERRAVEKRQTEERRKLDAALERARKGYAKAMERWRS